MKTFDRHLGTSHWEFDIEVFFDGSCPLCKREMQMLRRLDKKRRILFTDIAATSFRPDGIGVDWESLMGRIHGRLPEGTMLEGVDVFRHLYTVLGFRKLVRLSRMPGISHLIEVAYHLFAAHRMRFTGRCPNSNNHVRNSTAPIPGPTQSASRVEGK